MQSVFETTDRAAAEIQAVKGSAAETVSAAADIGCWTERLSREATELEARVDQFFAAVATA
jgi:hypothetical protein